MILDTSPEEIAPVEMPATLIAGLRDRSPADDKEDAAASPAVGALLGGARIEDAVVAGMNPRHAVVPGGAQLAAPNG